MPKKKTRKNPSAQGKNGKFDLCHSVDPANANDVTFSKRPSVTVKFAKSSSSCPFVVPKRKK